MTSVPNSAWKKPLSRLLLAGLGFGLTILASLIIASPPPSRTTDQPPSPNPPTTTVETLPQIKDIKNIHDFSSIADALKALVETKNPTAAFAALKTLITTSPELDIQCHSLVHEIGDAAFAKYHTFQEAQPFNDDMCGSGYLHSLILNTLRQSPDPETVIASVCQGQDGYCYHGIGHGLMFYTKNDVPRALTYCTKLTTPEQANRCSEGVFMQNFETDQEDPTPYLYPQDPLKLCRDEKTFKAACYLYAGEYLALDWKTHPSLFEACTRAEPNQINACIRGVGAYVMAVNLPRPKRAETFCDSAPTTSTKNACIDGLVSYELVQYNSLPHAETFCASFAAENVAACTRSLEARRRFYE